jgi:hypothetical protein
MVRHTGTQLLYGTWKLEEADVPAVSAVGLPALTLLVGLDGTTFLAARQRALRVAIDP